MSYSLSSHMLTLSFDRGYLANEKGKATFFKNSIEMMSFFGKDGWELVFVVSTYGSGARSNSTIAPYEFYFKKDVTGWSEEHIKNFLNKYKLTKITVF